MTLVIVWEYDVPAENAEHFEEHYGESGVWAQFFAQANGFQKTMLLRKAGGGYVTLDFWNSRADYDAFMARARERYEGIDRECESLTSAERCIGKFESYEPAKMSKT